MRKPLRAAPILATCFALLCGVGQAIVAGSSGDGYERIVARFNSAAPPSYQAYRRMEAGLVDSERRGWIEVLTSYSPDRGLTYKVLRAGGSESVRDNVLIEFLKRERELVASGTTAHPQITAKDYSLEDAGIGNDGVQRVTLTATRKAEGLMNGTLFLRPEAGYVSRMQGRLVKSPSFWVRDVDVTWKFTRVGRHVVPVELSSTGRVRILGPSDFRMVYQYISIDGQPTGAAVLAERE